MICIFPKFSKRSVLIPEESDALRSAQLLWTGDKRPLFTVSFLFCLLRKHRQFFVSPYRGTVPVSSSSFCSDFAVPLSITRQQALETSSRASLSPNDDLFGRLAE